jgi:hypothetical protein
MFTFPLVFLWKLYVGGRVRGRGGKGWREGREDGGKMEMEGEERREENTFLKF